MPCDRFEIACAKESVDPTLLSCQIRRVQDDNGPKNLRHLFGMLPSLSSAIRGGSFGGTHKSVSTTKPAARICTICGKPHSHSNTIDGTEFFGMNCKECQDQLEAGYTALRSPDHRYAFVRGGELEPGIVLTVSQATMNIVKEKLDENKPPTPQAPDNGCAQN